ncbi:MAG: hypothetical protein H0U54_01005, partial [Acidobacteria bacterium]|nr:hypothetical protein [Acidobacteriota bacterium]
MKYSFQKKFACAFGLVLMLGLSATFVSAQKKRLKDAARHASAAARVFDQVMAVRDRSIPRELLDRAEAIAVFPGVVKAAFI